MLLARIEQEIAEKVLAGIDCANARFQHVDEKKLDWVYPSYDLCVQSLLNPLGAKFSIYRNKISKFRKQGINIIAAGDMVPREFRTAIARINKSRIRTKMNSGTSFCEDITVS